MFVCFDYRIVFIFSFLLTTLFPMSDKYIHTYVNSKYEHSFSYDKLIRLIKFCD